MRRRRALAFLIETGEEPQTGSNPTFDTGDAYEMTGHSLSLFVLASAAA
jgi:hypothetical protein